MTGRLLRQPLTWVVVAVLGGGAAVALYWFQPWKLVVDRQVDEALTAPSPAASPAASPLAVAASTSGPAGPQVLAEGTFVTHEHATSGSARVIRNADGSRRLELVGLDTSNGPDLRVWLTDQPVIQGRDGWFVFDDGRYHELGRLKGNKGDQAYEIPAGVDLTGFRSVSIWCKRFAVSFGAAALDPA